MSDFPTRELRDRLRSVLRASAILQSEVTNRFADPLTPGAIAGQLDLLDERLAYLAWATSEARVLLDILMALADEDDQVAWDALGLGAQPFSEGRAA